MESDIATDTVLAGQNQHHAVIRLGDVIPARQRTLHPVQYFQMAAGGTATFGDIFQHESGRYYPVTSAGIFRFTAAGSGERRVFRRMVRVPCSVRRSTLVRRNEEHSSEPQAPLPTESREVQDEQLAQNEGLSEGQEVSVLEEARELVAQNSGEKNSGEKNSGEKNSGEKNSGEKNSGEKNSGEKTSGEKTSGEKTSGAQIPREQIPGEQNPVEQASGEQISGPQTPGPQTPFVQNLGDPVEQNSGEPIHEDVGQSNVQEDSIQQDGPGAQHELVQQDESSQHDQDTSTNSTTMNDSENLDTTNEDATTEHQQLIIRQVIVQQSEGTSATRTDLWILALCAAFVTGIIIGESA